MATTPYTTLYTGDRSVQIAYKPAVDVSQQVFPDADTYNILGQLYAPRIYGKNLTAFELASSGSIAMTMQDTHALDIDRDAASSNVTIRTVANDGLLLSLTNSNVGSILLGLDSNMAIKAGSNLTASACNVFVNAAQNMALTAVTNLTATAASTVSISASNTVNVQSASNVRVSGSNQAQLVSGSNSLTFTPSSASLQTNSGPLSIAASNVITLRSTSNVSTLAPAISLAASNSVTMQTAQMTVTASNVNYSLSNLTLQAGTQNSLVMSTSNATLTSGSNAITMTDSNVSIASTSNMSLYAANSMTISSSNLSLPTGNMTITTTSNLTMTGGQQVSIASGSNSMVMTPTNVNATYLSPFTMTACNNVTNNVTGSFILQAGSNVSMTAASNFGLQVGTSATLSTGSNLFLTGGSQVSLISGNNSFKLTPTAVTASYVSPYTMSACNNATIAVGGNYTLNSMSNLTMSAKNTLSGTGDAQVKWSSGCNMLSISPSNATLSVGTSLVELTGSNLNTVSSSVQRMYVNPTGLASGTPIVELSSSGSKLYGTQHDLYVVDAGTSAISVYRDGAEAVLRVRGRLDIDGEINTINQTLLNVVDKTINLAYPDNNSVSPSNVVDGIANDKAGVLVYGKPTTPSFSNAPNGADPQDMTTRYYEKSLLWNMGSSGMDSLGKATGIDYTNASMNESFWEMRGGHFQMTLPQTTLSGASNVVRDVSYGFRINERGELELFKRSWDTSLNAYKARRLSRWGHGNGML